MAEIVRATMEDVVYVARNMRPRDRDEIYACFWEDDPAVLAGDVMAFDSFSWVVRAERPIAAMGAIPLHPGVWSVWLFATIEFNQISLLATKFVRRVMMPSVRAAGAHRAECRSLDVHTEAHQWLEFLGARREAVLRQYGRNKEDFYLYAWSE